MTLKRAQRPSNTPRDSHSEYETARREAWEIGRFRTVTSFGAVSWTVHAQCAAHPNSRNVDEIILPSRSLNQAFFDEEPSAGVSRGFATCQARRPACFSPPALDRCGTDPGSSIAPWPGLARGGSPAIGRRGPPRTYSCGGRSASTLGRSFNDDSQNVSRNFVVVP